MEATSNVHRAAPGRLRRRKRTALAAVGIGVVALLTACNPGDVAPQAGTGVSGYTGDGGASKDATLADPGSVVADPAGGFYVMDHSACAIRKVSSAGTITTVAGNGTCAASLDGGLATESTIEPLIFQGYSSQSMTLGSDGTLYFIDYGSQRIRAVGTDGIISTVAGAPGAPVCPDGATTPIGIEAMTGGDLMLNCETTLAVLHGASASDLFSEPNYISSFAIAPSDAGTLKVVYATGDFPSDLKEFTLVSGEPSQVSITDLRPHFEGIDALAVAADGTIYASGAAYITRISADGATAVLIAGNGEMDPYDTAQSGTGLSLALAPLGVALSPAGDNLYFSSGHVAYRLEQPAKAPSAATPGTGTGGGT